MRPADIVVGKAVRVETGERLQLAELATLMTALAREGRPGWFIEYVRLHKQGLGIFQQIRGRTHT